MSEDEERPRDLAGLAVPLAGSLQDTGDPWSPFRLIDPDGLVVEAVSVYFRDMQAADRSATVRSYGMDLLRWVPVPVGDRDAVAGRHGSRRAISAAGCWWRANRPARTGANRPRRPTDRPLWWPYAPAVRAHSETVLRGFYDFHLDAGGGPLMNPFPLDRARRAHAHHNPMEPHRNERTGRYRSVVPDRIPRSVSDAEFNEIFAQLPSHRDRALVAFYVSTGARASELLSVTQGGVDPGRQLITVIRKGSRAAQELPASTDAFVWLRLHQVQTTGLIPQVRAAAAVVDVPNTGAAVDLSRGAPHVRVGGRRGRKHCHVARAASLGGLSDGRRPCLAVDRRPVRPGARADAGTAGSDASSPCAAQPVSRAEHRRRSVVAAGDGSLAGVPGRSAAV